MVHICQKYIDGLQFIANYYNLHSYQVPAKPTVKTSAISLHVYTTRWEEFSFCSHAYITGEVIIHADLASFDGRLALNFSKDDGVWALADCIFRGIDSEYKK